MKFNVTTVLLLGVLALVAYKLVGPNVQAMIGSGATSPNSNPVGGTPAAAQAQPDLFSTILNTASSIMGSIASISQSNAKTV